MNQKFAGVIGIIFVFVMLTLSYLGFIDLEEMLDELPESGTTTETTTQNTPTSESDVETAEEPVLTGTTTNGSTDTAVTSTGWYDIYFTNPSCPAEEERAGGVEEVLVADMLTAQNRLDIASFDFDIELMIDALIELEDRGVEVRIVVDDEHTPASAINRLRRNGMSVIEDQRSALMHNKFIIIDGRYLWTGSMNFASNGVYCNNNNLVRFDSPQLAQNYTIEFEEMYIDREFGPRSPINTKQFFNVNGITIENYFTAEEEVAEIIAGTIAEADQEILFMAFSFTNDTIGESVIERANAGVPVFGVFEAIGSETVYSYYSQLEEMAIPGVNVKQDGNGRIMHHKVFIIDREITVLGSFNFSDNAIDSNDENLLIIRDPEFTSYFVEEFGFIWDEAQADS